MTAFSQSPFSIVSSVFLSPVHFLVFFRSWEFLLHPSLTCLITIFCLHAKSQDVDSLRFPVQSPPFLCQIFLIFLNHSNIKSVTLIINLCWWITHLQLSGCLTHRRRKSDFQQCVSYIWCVIFSIFLDEEWGKSHPGCAGLEKSDFVSSCVKHSSDSLLILLSVTDERASFCQLFPPLSFTYRTSHNHIITFWRSLVIILILEPPNKTQSTRKTKLSFNFKSANVDHIL